MELKVGMYVKYKRGAINGYVAPRIAKITDCSDKYLIKIDNGQVILKADILKESFDIIDLIQAGDIVNGEKVGYVDEFIGAMRQYYYDYEDINKDCGHWQEEIETILTKEQFENNVYRIGE